MNNEAIDHALAALPSLFFNNDGMGVRELIEGVYDAGARDLLDSLVTVEYAAARWDVSERRARAHIAALNAKHNIGWQINGGWVMRRSDVDKHAPQQKYRRNG